jgi:protein-tyrosine-phosphatase
MSQIIFICTANICRSPMAEGIFSFKAQEAGRSDLTASSMGIHGHTDIPAAELAQQACMEHGIDLSAHRSQPLDGEILRQADFVFCMEAEQRRFLQTFFPWHRKRIFLMGAWPGKETRKSPVQDPMGAPIKIFRKAYDVIEKHVDRILSHL